MYGANQYYRPKQVGNVITRISRALLRVPYRVREPRHVAPDYCSSSANTSLRSVGIVDEIKTDRIRIEVIKAAALIVLRPLHVPQDVCITGERGETGVVGEYIIDCSRNNRGYTRYTRYRLIVSLIFLPRPETSVFCIRRTCSGNHRLYLIRQMV